MLLHQPLHLAAPVAVAFGRPLVMLLLAAGKTEPGFDDAAIIETERQRNQRVSRLLDLSGDAVELALAHQELARAERIVVEAVAMTIFRDMRIEQIQALIFKGRIGVLNVGLAGAQALDLRAMQDQAPFKFFMNEVVVAGLAVFGDRSTSHNKNFRYLSSGCPRDASRPRSPASFRL